MHTMPSKEERSNTIGFIGLGAMGNHMVCLYTRRMLSRLALTVELAQQLSQKIAVQQR